MSDPDREFVQEGLRRQEAALNAAFPVANEICDRMAAGGDVTQAEICLVHEMIRFSRFFTSAHDRRRAEGRALFERIVADDPDSVDVDLSDLTPRSGGDDPRPR